MGCYDVPRPARRAVRMGQSFNLTLTMIGWWSE